MAILSYVRYFNERLEEFEDYPYFYLHSTSQQLPPEEIDALMWNIADMEHLGESSRFVRSDSYHAKVTRAEPTVLGHYFGVPYSVEFDIGSERTDKLGVFVIKQPFPTYTRN